MFDGVTLVFPPGQTRQGPRESYGKHRPIPRVIRSFCPIRRPTDDPAASQPIEGRPGDPGRGGVRSPMSSRWRPERRVGSGSPFRWIPNGTSTGKTPGTPGGATDIDWSGGDLEFGPLKWSAPERFTESNGELTVFGYADRVIMFSEVTVEPNDAALLEVATPSVSASVGASTGGGGAGGPPSLWWILLTAFERAAGGGDE